MIQIVPLTSDHVISLLAQGVIECSLRVTDANDAVRQLAQQYENCIGSVTAMEDGKPLFCAILKMLWTGVAELGALLSVDFPARKIAACRAARDVLGGMIKTNNLHRVHTTVRCDFQAGQRFAEWLGFKAEGIARQYTHDGMDSIYYAIIRT